MRAAADSEPNPGQAPQTTVQTNDIGRTAVNYLPAGLLARLCATPDRTATIPGVLMFSDIVQSTALIKRFAADSSRGVERLSQLLNDYFAHVFSVIAAHGGEVVRLEGDACFALWPIDAEAPEHALDCAAACALALSNTHVVEADDASPGTRHRLALAAGPVQAEIHEVDSARAFLLVHGAPFDELRGALSHGQGGEILVSPATAALLGPAAELAADGAGGLRLTSLRRTEGADSSALPPAAAVPALGPVSEIAGRLVSHAVRARLASQVTQWLAEFRQISVLQILFPESIEAGQYDAHRSLVLVEQALAPLRMGVWEVSYGDKGANLTVVFGLPPFTREHGARWAVEAARKIADTLRHNVISAAIGVATGEALYGEVGNADRRSEYLTGPVMMRATRLAQAAGENILCDGATAELCSPDYQFETAGTVSIKAQEDPIPAHRPAGASGPRAPPRQATAPPIGREPEMARIAAHLANSGAGPSVLVIQAEAGAGKSHLLAASASAARETGLQVCEAAANPIEALTPYFVFQQVIPWLAGHGPQRPADEFRAALRQALAGHPLGESPAALDAVMSVGWSYRGSAPPLGADARAGAIEEIVIQLALARSGTGRLVLAIDDAQWLDAASARLVAVIAERVRECRILAALRPLEEGLGGATQLTAAAATLALQPLNGDHITAIVCRLLGVDELPDRLREILAERAEGIPLYAEQFVFALRQRGLLDVISGRCRLKADDIAIRDQPRSIRELIAGRIDLLSRRDQIVLKAASAIGREIPAALVAAVCPIPLEPHDLAASAMSLASAGFLSGLAAMSQDLWTFRHGVVRDVVYGSLTLRQRQPLHEAIAAWLRKTYADDLSPVYESLAEHYEGAGQRDPAIAFGIKAAEQALERFANTDALARLERVRALLDAEPMRRGEEQSATVALLFAQAYHGLSRFSDARRNYQLYTRLSGIPLPVTTRRILLATPVEIAEQVGRRLGLLGAAGSETARARARTASRIFTAIAEQAFFENDPLRLFYYTMGGLNRAERARDDRETAIGFGAMTIGLGGARLHRLARIYRENALAAAQRTGDVSSVGFTNLLATVYSSVAGDWAATRRCGEAGYLASLRAGDRHRAETCRLLLAFMALWRGQFEDADQSLSEFGPNAEAARNVQTRAWFRYGRVLHDMTVRGADEAALEHLSIADDAELPHAERLMCRGLRAGIRMRRGERAQAHAEAGEVLAGMKLSPITLGISLDGICAMALVHFDELCRAARPSRALREAARDACTVATRFSRQNLIGRPRALILHGRLAELRRSPRRAAGRYHKAAHEASRLGLPMDEAAALVALGAVTGQPEAVRRGEAVMDRFAARPWYLDQLVPRLARNDFKGSSEHG